MGSTKVITFCIIFFISEAFIIYALDNPDVADTFLADTAVIDIQPPPEPEYNTPWYYGGAITDATKAAWYNAALFAYSLSQYVNGLSVPLNMANRIVSFSIYHPAILLINIPIIAIFLYLVVSRIIGGGD